MEIDWDILQCSLRELLEESRADAGVDLANKWVRGTLVFQPGDASMKPHEIPIRTFFKKVISMREKLRVLEQKLNNHPALDEGEKVVLQGYLTRCYGSLTSFNFLFKNREDGFRGGS